ncbi:hypothetical protein BH23PLA1_BH23PLA1_06330 [soil metagenome]
MIRYRTLATALAVGLCWATAGLSQDNALDKLLEEIDAKAKTQDTDAPADQPAKPGTVAPKDKALDDLLEKLGQTPDRPQTQDDPRQRGASPPPSDDMDKDQGDDEDQAPADDDSKPKPRPLGDDDQSLDRHLEELQGKIRKPEDDDESGASGQLGETLRKMREAEQRLAKLDTGDETQQRQKEIVEGLEQILERIRKMQQGQEPGQIVRSVEMDGQQPGQQGQQQGNTPGAQPGEAPEMTAQNPDTRPGIADAKDTWGHLQGSLRDVMGNVSRMMPLRGKEDLINRYFESVAKRNVSR